MKGTKAISVGSALFAGLAAVLATCAKPPRMPAVDGAVIEIRRSDGMLRAVDPGYANTLQLYWFGTGCHLIQLGGVSVLTDPFVTNELKVLGMESNALRVEGTFGRIVPPDAVLINHSHHDHILDAYAAMSLRQWKADAVPLYGGRSAVNVLAGFDRGVVDPRWFAVGHGAQMTIVARNPNYSAKITAFETKHSPHLKCGFTLTNRLVSQPLTSPPRNFNDFQAGEVHNFLVELRAPGGVSFNVFYLGAPFHLDERPDSLPPTGTHIDVAIILAPSNENVRGYPEKHLARLRPRQIVLSHFNTFLKEDPDEQLAFGPFDFVKMPKLSRDVQATFARNAVDYPEFEKMHIPAITVMGGNGTARNVIQIR